MLVSPFTFYRGGAAIMAADLAATPSSGLQAQLCGDAHLENFRATERFTTWRGLIGPYFDGAPVVEHFSDVS